MKRKNFPRPINGVTVITSTNKPQFLNNIFDNYSRQLYNNKQLIIILNSNLIDANVWVEKAKAYANVWVHRLPDSVSLGECLNFAVDRSSYNVISKFDDDDYYSPYYLTSAVKALRRTNADIVGKRSVLTYLEDDGKLILRFPGNENKYQHYVAGGTITFRKSVFQRVRFSALSIGEDVDFMTKCRQNGYKLFATSRYNYVYIRRPDPNMHTWRPNKSYLLKTGRHISYTRKFWNYATKKL
ncbi:glycosyltransferase [Paenibacillus harenae]|uniref:glycosyltransferase n=1 Tax=Paenibacillus harenae TaxID=306543 RepID=UPI00278F9F81|nr:glycosyltransferase [Paenibacillus harenae]MDQ0058851.1 hypothetical protein [Paenibacillus harenae]